MGRNNAVKLTLLFSLLVLIMTSCSPDCKEVTVKVADWQTRYEDYWVEFDTVKDVEERIDTMVAYTVEKYYTKMTRTVNSSGNATGATRTHYITIRNNNNTYSNQFAVAIEGKKYNESRGVWQDMSKSTSYATIYPNSTYTFSISHEAWWYSRDNGYNEDNVTLHIRQYSNNVMHTSKKIVHVRQKRTRRIDKLIVKDTVVNNCECDIDALEAKNIAVQELFESLKEQKLIRTE